MIDWKVSLVLAVALCGSIHAAPKNRPSLDELDFQGQKLASSNKQAALAKKMAELFEYAQKLPEEAAYAHAMEEQAGYGQEMNGEAKYNFGNQLGQFPFEVDEQQEVVRELHKALPYAAPAEFTSENQLEDDAFKLQKDNPEQFEDDAADFVQEAVARAIAEQVQRSYMAEVERRY